MGGRGAASSNNNNSGGGGQITGNRSEFRSMARDLDRSNQITKNLPLSEVGRLGREAYSNISGGRVQQYQALQQQVRNNGWNFRESLLPRGNGIANHRTKTITIRSDLNTGQKIRTLAHEIAHSKLHANNTKSLARQEIEAEMVSRMVSEQLGVRGNSAYSNHYINGWQRHGNINRSNLSTYEKDVIKTYDEIMNGFEF